MPSEAKPIRGTILAVLMVLSVIATGAAGLTAADSTSTPLATNLQDDGPTVQSDSAKSLTLSWFRRAGSANGPFPVPPNEYEGNDSAGITMFTNAEGDAVLRVDNSTAENPNGKWDMVVLNVEVDGLSALNPPESGWNKGLVTQEFIDNSNWNLEIEQTNGDKTLDLAANQENFEPPEFNRHTPHEVPPVMIFADTEEIEGDYLLDEAPDTSLYVWIDPNRATLSSDTSFQPGESYEATFTIDGQTETTDFHMVDGTADVPDDLTVANSFGETVEMRTTLSAGSMVRVVMEPETGENQTRFLEVEGNREYGGDTKGTVERGYIRPRFDFTGMGGESFKVHVYAPGYVADAEFTGEFRDQDVWTEPQHRIHMATGSGTVENVIDPGYTIPNATIRDSKSLTIAYTNPDHTTPEAIATQVGDGHLSGDTSIAYNADAEPRPYYDEMFLHYETSDQIFAAIRKSPGDSGIEKFLNSPMSLTVEQTNGDKRLNLSRNSSGVFVVPDDGQSDPRLYNSSTQTGLFFSFKLNSMRFFANGEAAMPRPGDRFAATLTIETEQGTVEETTHFRFVREKTMIINQPGELQLPKSDDATVSWNSTLARGTAMGVRLTAPNADFNESSGEITLSGLGPSICCDGASTEPWGTAEATFDTSGLEIGTEVTATVAIVADLPGDYPDRLVLAEMSGEIVAPPTGSVSMSDQSGDGSTVNVDSVEMNRGGFVSIHTGSPNGRTIGASDFLESGTHEDVEVELDQVLTEDQAVYALLHTDTNNNQEFDFPVADDPITENDEFISASADYTVTETATSTTTTSDGDGDGDGADGDGGDGGMIPGFGVGIAIAALALAMLLAYRRD